MNITIHQDVTLKIKHKQSIHKKPYFSLFLREKSCSAIFPSQDVACLLSHYLLKSTKANQIHMFTFCVHRQYIKNEEKNNQCVIKQCNQQHALERHICLYCFISVWWKIMFGTERYSQPEELSISLVHHSYYEIPESY